MFMYGILFFITAYSFPCRRNLRGRLRGYESEGGTGGDGEEEGITTAECDQEVCL